MLESQVVVNCPKWVLGMKLPCSEEQLVLLTAEVISTDLRGCFVLYSISVCHLEGSQNI